MKLRDALSRIPPRDPANKWSGVGFTEMAKLVGLGEQYLVNEKTDEWDARTRDHYIIKWYCTDQWVGVSVLLLDDEPVIIATQDGRKSDINYEFVSKEAFEKMREAVLALIAPEPEMPVPLANLDENIGDDYIVNYESQLMHSTGTVDGKPVQIIRFHRDWQNDNTKWRAFHDAAGGPREYIPGVLNPNEHEYAGGKATVRYADGTIAYVPIASVRLPFDLTP